MFALPAVLSFLLSAPHRFEHPATPTRIDVRDLSDVLTDAHRDVFGRSPSRARLGMAIGQTRLEGLALPGRNLGGLEYVPGRPWVRVDRLTRLRAFDSYADAARAYWSLLAARCAGALVAFDSGDPSESARRLKRCGYFGAPEEWYRTGLAALRTW
jgi:hypothetical protein